MGIVVNSRFLLTYEDYERFPDDGGRHQVVGGEEQVTPAPGPRHQLVSQRIFVQLYRQIAQRRLGQVFYAPVAVRLTETDIVEPDILVVTGPNAHRVKERWIEGPPDLVVEVVSPGSERIDRVLKKERYEMSGVPEYWLVEPELRVVEPYRRAREGYELGGRQASEVVFEGIAGVRIDLGDVW